MNPYLFILHTVLKKMLFLLLGVFFLSVTAHAEEPILTCQTDRCAIYNDVEKLINTIENISKREIVIAQYLGLLSATRDSRIKVVKKYYLKQSSLLAHDFEMAGIGLSYAFRGNNEKWIQRYRNVQSPIIKEWAQALYIRHLSHKTKGVDDSLNAMISDLPRNHSLTIESASYYYLNSGQPERLLSLVEEILTEPSQSVQYKNHLLFPAVAISMQKGDKYLSLDIYEVVKSHFSNTVEWDHFHYSVSALLAAYKDRDFANELDIVDDSLMVLASLPYIYDYFHLSEDAERSKLAINYILSFIDNYRAIFGDYAAALALIKISNQLFII